MAEIETAATKIFNGWVDGAGLEWANEASSHLVAAPETPVDDLAENLGSGRA